MKGPAGYGRYDDNLERIGCPYARTRRSPCIARDGRLSLVGIPPLDKICIGCRNTPEYLIEELAGAYEPARSLLAGSDPVTLADEFAIAVREATEPGKGEP